MNENEYFKANDDGIGIDPTLMPVIESLDVLPSDKKEEDKNAKKTKVKKKSTTPNPDKKPGDLLKKIIFTIVVIALMAGVAFGVYYYLSLGSNTPSKSKFSLQNRFIYVGDTLPTNVMEYGDFSTVDVSECSIDIDEVDVNKVGTYDYAIVCGKAKYTAKVIVSERISFEVEAKAVYKKVNDSIKPEDFIDTKEDGYSFSFTDENTVKGYLESAGGPYAVNINVKKDDGNETVVNSLLYVTNQSVNMYLTCNSSKQSGDIYAYTITDKIAFDSSRNNLGISLRSYNYVFETQAEYELIKSTITDGKIKIDEHEGFALIDNVNHKIKVYSLLTNEMLNDEFGDTFSTSYNDINSYYRNTKKYSCSI